MNLKKQYGYFEISVVDFPDKNLDGITEVLFEVRRRLQEYFRQVHPELLVQIIPQILPQNSITNALYYRAGWEITITDYSDVKASQFYTAVFFDSTMERFNVKDSTNSVLTLVHDFKRMKEYYNEA